AAFTAAITQNRFSFDSSCSVSAWACCPAKNAQRTTAAAAVRGVSVARRLDWDNKRFKTLPPWITSSDDLKSTIKLDMDMPRRRIMMVSSEVSPWARSGGLADVLGALPGALR